MKENSYRQIKDYFENLVTQSKFLNGFAGFFQRELADKLTKSNGMQSPYLAMFKYNLGFDGPDQNTIAVRQIGFAIIFRNIKPGAIENQYTAIDDAEKLAIKILSRIKYDASQSDHLLYNSFLKESVDIQPLELANNDFGVEVTFNLKNTQKLTCHLEDWKDIIHECL